MHHVRAASAALLAVCAGLAAGCRAIDDSVTGAPAPSVAQNVTTSTVLSRPTAQLIGSPENNAVFAHGEPVEFLGSGNSVTNGLPSMPPYWTSDRDGKLGTGLSLTRSDLSVGRHAVTLTIPGQLGTSQTETVVIEIVQNNVPAVTIARPASGAQFSQGTTIVFEGTATDAEDGDLGGAALSWASDLDGALGTGAMLSTPDLQLGTHTISLTATDSKNGAGTSTVVITIGPPTANRAPTAAISQPVHGAAFPNGAVIQFVGTGIDAEDGALSGGSLIWQSDRDGQIGSGRSFTRVLSPGDHRITLTATDAVGATDRDVRVMSVRAAATTNRAPSATIFAPASGSTFQQGALVTFSGTGVDPESGTLTGPSLAWTSSRDGRIGTGTSFSTQTLSVGTHSITLTARDPDGAAGSATRTVTVAAPTGG